MTEIWKPIKDYEGLYEVSNDGRVRSLNYKCSGKVKELSQKNINGYLRVQLYKEGKRKDFYVHRLVVDEFIGEIPKGLVVNHKDENKQNNNVDNLEICTYKYNNNYGSVKERISATLTGIKRSPETRAKMSAAKKGKKYRLEKKHSPEARAKISAAMKGKKNACKKKLKEFPFLH